MSGKRGSGKDRQPKRLKGSQLPEVPAPVQAAPEAAEPAESPAAPEAAAPEAPSVPEPSEAAAEAEPTELPPASGLPVETELSESPAEAAMPAKGSKRKAPKRLERPKKKHRLWPLFLGMFVYAVVFLSAALCGLFWLWDFVAAYERSLPDYAVNDYMQTLSANHIGDAALLDLLERVDLRVQSISDCRRRVLEYLQGETTCTRDDDASTDELQIFTLHHNGDVVGSFRMERRGFTSHGFTPWMVTAEHFDLTFLLTEPVSATIPEGYSLLVNDVPLPGECTVETGIPYEQLEQYPGNYEMPRMMRCEAGPFLGAAELTLLDDRGEPVTGELNSALFLDNCSDEERMALSAAVGDYLDAYVRYMTNSGGKNTQDNLNKLLPLILPKSELEKRVRNAANGLLWVPDRRASVTGWEPEFITRISEELYLCDVTYTAKLLSGTQENRLMLVYRQVDGSYYVEDMEQIV